jgi:hypothetical protein
LVTDAHAHVQRLVSIVKMATVLEKYPTKEQLSVVPFLWAKDSMKTIHTKKYIPPPDYDPELKVLIVELEFF